MSNQSGFFAKLKGAFSNLFGQSTSPKPNDVVPATPVPQPQESPKPEAPKLTLNELEVIAVITNFARQQCGNDYQPQIEVESLFTIGPSTQQSGSRKMVEWFMSQRPGLALMVMPQPGVCNVILAHGPNPPNKSGYMLGLSAVDSKNVPANVGALRQQLEAYVAQGKIAWRDGQWHYQG